MVIFSQSLAARARVPRSRHHDSSRSHRSAKREASPREIPEPRIQLELVDLDDLRDPIKIALKRTSRLDHITTFLKRRYCDEGDDSDDEPIREDAQVVYYWMDKCLLGNEIPSGISLLHYRVLESYKKDIDVNSDVIQMIWSSKVDFEENEVEKVYSAMANGETVGGLRRILASILEVGDPNRIVISARGGLRPGLLQGNNWKVSKVRAWLCQKIWIDVVPPKNYIILRGANEEYIYHPPFQDDDYSVDFRTLRNWLLSRIITNVHHRGSSRLRVDAEDVSLTCKGKVLSRRWRIPFGQTVDFEMIREMEDRFIAEEAWLVPETESCIVCGDDKRISAMPRRITRLCEHQPNTCRDCIGQWITSSMDTLAWDRLRCPECPQLLRFEDVRAFASREIFDRYDTLAMKSAVTGIRDFKWCLNPKCCSGQIVPRGCEKVKCHSCRASSCAHHNLPWHRGETCDEFDVRTRRQRKSDKASARMVQESTKACPKCHKDVHKFSGCDHITCVCGHEWCYVCLSTYYRDENSFLQCKHKTECRYFDNPPNYEGGRAFMPFLNQLNMNRQDWGFGPPPPQLQPQPGPGPGPQPPRGRFPVRPQQPPYRNPFQPVDPARPPPPPHEEAWPERIPGLARPGFQNDDDDARALPHEDPDPFGFLGQDFRPRVFHLPIDQWRRNRVDNEFLGAAAMFTLEQLMQRANVR